MPRIFLWIAIAVAWVALPLTALNYSRAWDRLPARIAVHFDANWQPNGWTSRESARLLALATTGFLLATFTFAAFVVSCKRTSSLSTWAMIVIFYVALVLVYRVNKWIVDRSVLPQQSAAVPTFVDHGVHRS